MSKGVGVFINRNEVIAVAVAHSITGPQIKGYAIEPINPSGEQEPAVGKEAHQLKKLTPEAKAIHKALGKIKEPGAFVTMAVSPSQVVTRHFIMPAVPPKEEANAVQFEANRYIPFKLADSVMNYHTHSAHKNVLSVTAVALKKDILEQALDDLRSVSCKILMVEPAYTAAARAFAAMNLLQKNKTCGFVVLQSDGNVNLTFSSKGTVYLSRDFLLAGSGEEDRKRFFDELKASLDYFYKLTGGEAIQQIFLAGHGDLKFWAEYFEQAFNYSLRFDLAKLPHETSIPPEVLGSILVAFGLAIRALGYKSPIGEIELLPKSDRRLKPEKFYSILGGTVAAIFIVTLLVRFVIFQPYIYKLQEQNDQIFGSGSGVDPAVVKLSSEELSQEINFLGERAAVLEKFMKNRVSTADILTALVQGLPKSITFDYASLEDAVTQEGKSDKGIKRLNLNGSCFLESAEKEAGEVNAWIKSLSEKEIIMKRFSEIKLEEIKRESSLSREVTKFKIICE